MGYADLDLCRDKTTFGHNGYGEQGSGFFGRVSDKPGVSKGRQIILLSDVSRVRPRAYLHCHKLHKLSPGWTVMGQYEVRAVLEQLKPTIQGKAGDCKKVFTKHPCSIWDNYFSSTRIMKKGYKGEDEGERRKEKEEYRKEAFKCDFITG
eukprot:5829329-Ditylum_brightwellii.AAC.1